MLALGHLRNAVPPKIFDLEFQGLPRDIHSPSRTFFYKIWVKDQPHQIAGRLRIVI